MKSKLLAMASYKKALTWKYRPVQMYNNYPPGLTNFFLFLQKCILHIQDGKKLPSSVISLVNSFHEHQSVLATCCASRSVRGNLRQFSILINE